jgi:hypothetical protein
MEVEHADKERQYAVADAGWKLRGAKTIEMLICMKI